MKILHAYKDFDPPVHGGVERHIALMCRYQREWAEVEALMCSRTWRTRRVERDGTSVMEVGEWGRFQSAPVAPMYPYYLRRMHADVVVIHVPNPTAELSYLLVRPRGRMVVRYHSDVIRQAMAMRLYKPFLMKLLAQADIIIPTSDRYVDSSPYLAPHREKCRVVPLGIVPEEFDSPRKESISRLHDRYGGRYVLFTGRHRYYKGLEYLIEAAPSINARVVISGDGPLRPTLEDMARRSGVDIAFPGRLTNEDLIDHLHGCAVFVFPSIARSEAFGISILEAHACGKPVVATTLGTGVEFANLHGQTGLNVPPRDADALAAAVNTLLHDSDEARRMGEFAQERVRREFDVRDVARREFELYRETN